MLAEAFTAEGINSARIGVAAHHIRVILANYQHDNRTEHKTDNTANGASLGKIGVGCDYKRAPSDAGAQSESPCSYRGEVSRQAFSCLYVHSNTSFLPKTFNRGAITSPAEAVCPKFPSL